MTGCFGERNFWNADRLGWRWGRNDPLLPLYLEVFTARPSSAVEGGLRGVIRRWTSNHTGTVRIAGFANKQADGGDGVRCEIHVQGQKVWSETLIAIGEVEFDVEVDLKAGDYVDFTVDPGPDGDVDSDAVTLTGQIRARKPIGIPGPVIASSIDGWSKEGRTRLGQWTQGFAETNGPEMLYDPNAFQDIGDEDADTPQSVGMTRR